VKALLVAALLLLLTLTGCDDDYDRHKYPPGYGVTPLPAPKVTTKAPSYRPVPAPVRKAK
jgi:hypothetical protein